MLRLAHQNLALRKYEDGLASPLAGYPLPSSCEHVAPHLVFHIQVALQPLTHRPSFQLAFYRLTLHSPVGNQDAFIKHHV